MSEPTYGMTNAVRASTTGAVRASATGTETSPAARDSLIIGDGQVSVAEGVIQKIAGKACRDISGVHSMDTGSARAFGAGVRGAAGAHPRQLRPERGPGRRGRGRETEAAIDLDILIEYGISTADLGRSIQRNVKQSVELMAGPRAVEVNVAVDDVCLPAPGEQDTTPSRVS